MKPRKVKGLEPAEPLADNAERIIRTRVAELRSFIPKALEPDAAEARHDMRIAAKRLRYVLEVTGFCFGEPAKTARRRSRALQDLLGELHDCDVMLPRAQAQIDELREEEARALLLRAGSAEDLDPRLVSETPGHPAHRGLELLVLHLHARRALLFERFRSFWQAEVSRGTWARLESAIERRDFKARGEENSSPAQRLKVARRETAERSVRPGSLSGR